MIKSLTLYGPSVFLRRAVRAVCAAVTADVSIFDEVPRL